MKYASQINTMKAGGKFVDTWVLSDKDKPCAMSNYGGGWVTLYGTEGEILGDTTAGPEYLLREIGYNVVTKEEYEDRIKEVGMKGLVEVRFMGTGDRNPVLDKWGRVLCHIGTESIALRLNPGDISDIEVVKNEIRIQDR